MGDLGHHREGRHLSRRRFMGMSACAAAGLVVGGCIGRGGARGGPEPRLITTLGDLAFPATGVILPHEHIFLDLRPPADPEHGQAPVDDVVEWMQPELERARAVGVQVLIDATPVGMGRRVDIVAAVSQAAGLPVVVATGLYRDPLRPEWARAASEAELREWMVGELTDRIEQTDVRAGWIKLGASPSALTEQEQKALRAAAQAGVATDATIGCHITSGAVARNALDILERSGFPAERFVWIHADQERDAAWHEEIARRGAWVEFDSIGHAENTDHVEMVQHMLDGGWGARLLLSMDSGWYDPGTPDCRAGCIKGYTYLSETFLPSLRDAGVDEATIDTLTRENPFHAFARPA